MDKDITTKLSNQIERINKGFDDLFNIVFHDYSKDINIQVHNAKNKTIKDNIAKYG